MLGDVVMLGQEKSIWTRASGATNAAASATASGINAIAFLYTLPVSGINTIAF